MCLWPEKRVYLWIIKVERQSCAYGCKWDQNYESHRHKTECFASILITMKVLMTTHVFVFVGRINYNLISFGNMTFHRQTFCQKATHCPSCRGWAADLKHSLLAWTRLFWHWLKKFYTCRDATDSQRVNPVGTGGQTKWSFPFGIKVSVPCLKYFQLPQTVI